MQVALYLVHIVFIFWLLLFLHKKYVSQPLGKILLPSVGLKILAGISLGVLYKYFYGYGDTLGYVDDTQKLIGFVHQYGLVKAIKCYYFLDYDLIPRVATYYYRFPGIFFFLKILVPIHWLCGSNYWLTCTYLSFCSGFTMWLVANSLIKLFPSTKMQASVAFLFFPSIVFWSSGLMRESLTMSAIALIWYVFLENYRKLSLPNWWQIILLIISAYSLLMLKYYYFVILIPVLILAIAWVILKKYNISVWVLLSLLLVFIISIPALKYIHPNLNIDKVLSVMVKNHNINYSFCFEAASGGNIDGQGIIFFKHLVGNAYSLLLNLPKSLFAGLFRPLLPEGNNIFYYIVGFGNFTMLILFLMSINRLILKKIQVTGLLLISILFIVLLAVLLPFTTPNLGTLARYKIAYQPIMVYLLLCGANINFSFSFLEKYKHYPFISYWFDK
ncbi:MAG: hypothetical protein RLZZ175_343 [Bacteroidota bacterium]|jgi:hypothetical protein